MNIITNWLLSEKAVVTLVIILMAILFLVLLSKFSKRYKNKVSGGEKVTAMSMVISILKFVIILTALLFTLQANGINVTSMVAGLGIASAIIGLALQDFLKDLITGLQIISDKFFSVGDTVLFQERECKVIGFSMRATKLLDLVDNSVITVSNRNISQIVVLGERVFVTVPIKYGEDAEKINAVLINLSEHLKSIDGVLDTEYRGIIEMASSSVNHSIMLTCNPVDRPKVKRIATTKIYEYLLNNNIEIPYNQLDVHIK